MVIGFYSRDFLFTDDARDVCIGIVLLVCDGFERRWMVVDRLVVASGCSMLNLVAFMRVVSRCFFLRSILMAVSSVGVWWWARIWCSSIVSVSSTL